MHQYVHASLVSSCQVLLLQAWLMSHVLPLSCCKLPNHLGGSQSISSVLYSSSSSPILLVIEWWKLDCIKYFISHKLFLGFSFIGRFLNCIFGLDNLMEIALIPSRNIVISLNLSALHASCTILNFVTNKMG